MQGFKKHLQPDAIYTEFSRAFDTINDFLLVRNLYFLEFPVDLLGWIM